MPSSLTHATHTPYGNNRHIGLETLTAPCSKGFTTSKTTPPTRDQRLKYKPTWDGGRIPHSSSNEDVLGHIILFESHEEGRRGEHEFSLLEKWGISLRQWGSGVYPKSWLKRSYWNHHGQQILMLGLGILCYILGVFTDKRTHLTFEWVKQLSSVICSDSYKTGPVPGPGRDFQRNPI